MSQARGHDQPVATPMYQRIANQLRQRILEGQYGPEDLLPSEKQLVAEFGIVRETARSAVNVLVQEGLITIRRGVGAYVRMRKPMVFRPQAEFEVAPSAEMDRFMAQITAEGRTPTQSIKVEVLAPAQVPGYVLEHLKPANDVVVLRKRERSIDGEPWNINDTYFPLDIVAKSEIMLPHDIARGANQVLEELGRRQVRVIDEWHFRQPTPEEADRLELPPGTAVGVGWMTGYDRDGLPVRCVYNVLPGDRHVLVYERTLPAE